jgi:plasmid replication initiation protein
VTRAKRSAIDTQFDLFLPYIADLPLRDQGEMMERPFFSLAKTKRAKPIEYTSPDGKLWVNVSTNPAYGMATIWDPDILIYCASMLADMARRGTNDISRTLHIMPYDLLRAIGRPTTGRAIDPLGTAIGISGTIARHFRNSGIGISGTIARHFRNNNMVKQPRKRLQMLTKYVAWCTLNLLNILYNHSKMFRKLMIFWI